MKTKKKILMTLLVIAFVTIICSVDAIVALELKKMIPAIIAVIYIALLYIANRNLDWWL